MAAKFSGRVKLGAVKFNDIKNSSGNPRFPNLFHNSSKTSYLVITPEHVKVFGKNVGEKLTYRSLFGFLRSLHPEINDLFILSLLLNTFFCSLDLLYPTTSLPSHVFSTLLSITKHNGLLLLSWLASIKLLKLFPSTLSIINLLLSFSRSIFLSDTLSLFRNDWTFYIASFQGRVVLIGTFFIIVLLHKVVSQKFMQSSSSHDNTTSSFGSLIRISEQITDYINTALFQNSARETIHADSNHDEEDNLSGMIIERLAVPDLWLRPLISLDYLHDLPVWRHPGWRCPSNCSSGGDEEDEEEEKKSGGTILDEGENGQPYSFICEKCKAALHPSKRRERMRKEREEIFKINSIEAAMLMMDGNYKCNCEQARGGGRRRARIASTSDELVVGDEEEDGGFHLRRRANVSLNHMDQHSSAPKGILASSECPICLDRYRRGDFLCGLPCGHHYHQNCIMGWLSRDNHCCPVCRWPAYKAKPCARHIASPDY